MKNRLARRVRRVGVTDPIAASRRYDYADAFEARLPVPDAYSPEAWVLAGLDAAPAAVKRITALLGMGDWRIVDSTPEVVHLEQSLPLMQVVLVGRRAGPTRRLFTTVLSYRRPILARLVWAVVGVAHRWTVRRFITSKMSTAAGGGDGDAERPS